MTINEDQKVHIFCAVLQAVIASATKGDQSLTPEALVKEAVHFTKEAIATANSSELLTMTWRQGWGLPNVKSWPCGRATDPVNELSMKWENYWAAVTLWFAFYNFCRFHRSIRITPAMEAGNTDHAWSVRELL
jgi:hypothetical protein